MNQFAPPPPSGPIRVRPNEPDPERVREGRHAARVTAERREEEKRRQRALDEQYPVIERDGQPPIRLRSTGGPTTLPRDGGVVIVGRVPRDPVDVLAERVGALEQGLQEILQRLDEAPAKRSWRRS